MFSGLLCNSYRESFGMLKQPKRESNSSQSMCEVKRAWSCNSTHGNVFIESCSVPSHLTFSYRVAQSVQCLTTDWTTGDRSPAEVKDFCSSFSVQTSSEAHLAFYPVGKGGPFPWG
jgi:hypothetical protein